MGTGELLDFERAWPRHSSHKETAIRQRGITPARYYVLLRRAAASHEGQAHDAVTAHRVVRRRAHVLPTNVGVHSHPMSGEVGPTRP